MMQYIPYLPVITTVFGLFFFLVLFKHWLHHRKALYIFWWMIGVLFYVAGTITESINAIEGFSVANFKAWYITGALLGGAPLAQGTVYLLCKRGLANTITVILVLFIITAATLVIISPVNLNEAAKGRLSGSILGWHFIRYMTPFINLYAFIFLVGGAIYSAVKYAKQKEYRRRFSGNLLIAVGGLLPGIGGSMTKFGYVEVLYVTELIGLILIYLGYLTIRRDSSTSLHEAQQTQIAEPVVA